MYDLFLYMSATLFIFMCGFCCALYLVNKNL